MQKYNDNMLDYNRAIKSKLAKDAKARKKLKKPKRNIWFGKLRGLRENWEERCIDRDGGHLKQAVMDLHFNNFKRFIQYQTPHTTEL